MPKNGPELDRLKSEMLDHLRSTGLPVFYSLGFPGEDGFVYWDAEQYPDWRHFVDVARESGARMFLFSSHGLVEHEIDDARTALDEVDLSPTERDRAIEFMNDLRTHLGQQAWVRIGWQQDARRFAFERVAPWYEQFLSMLDEIADQLPGLNALEDEEEEEGPGGRGGYYSLN